MADNARWFVVHTYSGYENKVASNITTVVENRKMQDQIFEVRIPTETVTEIKDDKVREIERKLFPGYVFCRMELYKEDGERNEFVWTFIHSVQGVITFSCGGDNPMPMSDEEIGIWINGPDQQEDAVRPAVTYQIGDHVRITDGPLESSTGVVSAVDAEEGKLKLTVPIFGRYNTIEVELWQVERDEE